MTTRIANGVFGNRRPFLAEQDMDAFSKKGESKLKLALIVKSVFDDRTMRCLSSGYNVECKYDFRSEYLLYSRAPIL
jgi:hypothetical protein